MRQVAETHKAFSTNHALAVVLCGASIATSQSNSSVSIGTVLFSGSILAPMMCTSREELDALD
jgi:uncharacterized membrane protein YgdD (TMEM256/DUF423 family)